MNYLIEIVGWAAALLILAAYGLLSLGKLQGKFQPKDLISHTFVK